MTLGLLSDGAFTRSIREGLTLKLHLIRNTPPPAR